MKVFRHTVSSRSRVLRWALPALMLLPLLGVAACDEETPIMVGSVSLVRHDEGIVADASNHGTVTASCRTGEHLVSGGFATYSSETGWGFSVAGSFPSDAKGQPSSTPDSWTVWGGDVSGVSIDAFVNCVKASKPIAVSAVVNEQVYNAANPGPANQDIYCPQHTTRTGGGFRTQNVFGPASFEATTFVGYEPGPNTGAMYPVWPQNFMVQGGVRKIQKQDAPEDYPYTVDDYAVCVAITAFVDAPLISKPFDLLPGTPTATCAAATACRVDPQGTFQVSCPSGQLVVGGGYSSISPSVITPTVLNVGFLYASVEQDALSGDEASWYVKIHSTAIASDSQPGGELTGTIWAICVTPQ